MKIQISRTDLVEALVHALNETDCVAARTSENAFSVSVPWAAHPGDPGQAQMEILFFVRSWGLPHAGFHAQLA